MSSVNKLKNRREHIKLKRKMSASKITLCSCNNAKIVKFGDDICIKTRCESCNKIMDLFELPYKTELNINLITKSKPIKEYWEK